MNNRRDDKGVFLITKYVAWVVTIITLNLMAYIFIDLSSTVKTGKKEFTEAIVVVNTKIDSMVNEQKKFNQEVLIELGKRTPAIQKVYDVERSVNKAIEDINGVDRRVIILETRRGNINES